MKINKSDITKALNDLPQYEVLTFNSYRAMPKGSNGMPDHILIGKSRIIFIEVKLYRDKLSSKQILIGDLLIALSKLTKRIDYYILTDKNYNDVIEGLLQ